MDFKAEVVIQAEESDVAVAAEDGRDSHVSGGFEALLKPPVNSRRMRGLRSPPRMTVEMGQQPVAELFEL